MIEEDKKSVGLIKARVMWVRQEKRSITKSDKP